MQQSLVHKICKKLFTILFAFDWKFSEIQFKVVITNSTLSKQDYFRQIHVFIVLKAVFIFPGTAALMVIRFDAVKTLKLSISPKFYKDTFHIKVIKILKYWQN